MSKKEKEVVKTPEQTKFEKEQKELQEKTEKVAKEVEVILTKNDMALQPFLMSSEYGIVPRVRLAPVPKETQPDLNINPKNDK